MPTYAYRCPDCGTHDLDLPMNHDPSELSCPKCGKELTRVWSFSPIRSGQEQPPSGRRRQ